MNLKPSLYNHFHTWSEGRHIVYNALSGTIAVMSDDEVALLKRLANQPPGPPDVTWAPDEMEFIGQLHLARFLRRADCNELDYLRFQHDLDKYDRTVLNLSIAPTMACNMACRYCYESNKHGRMSTKVINALIDMVQKHTPEIRRLDVGWYGGEPLLAMDIIDHLSTEFINICDSNKIRYGASLISNGYLLTPEVVDRLCALRVNSAQVCLDGPARIHNLKRPLKNGELSYEKIRDNLRYAADKLKITVRVNIDKSYDRDMIIELLEDLKRHNLEKRTSVVFGRVNVASSACSNISESCYDVAQFAQIQADFYQVLLEQGFRIENIPAPRSIPCMAQSVNAFLIDPDGDVYRCLIFPGDKSKSIGNVIDEFSYLHPNYLAMFDFNPFQDPTCRECSLLPACMGGCPSQRAYKGLNGDDMCDSWKYNLGAMLEIIAQAKLQNPQEIQEALSD